MEFTKEILEDCIRMNRGHLKNPNLSDKMRAHVQKKLDYFERCARAMNLVQVSVEEIAEYFDDTSIIEELSGESLICSNLNAYSDGETLFIIYEKGGKLFEVNASHCSYYGFEGQWNPEETCYKVLEMRVIREIKDELLKSLRDRGFG